MAFSEKRTTAAAAHLLSKSDDKRINYMKLIKLLYIADRSLMQDNEAPITLDNYVAMKNGMVLNNTYSLIQYSPAEENSQEEDSVNIWHTYIKRARNYTVILIQEVSPELKSALSKKEIEILDKTWEDHGNKDQWKLVDLLHDSSQFPEWKDPYPFGVLDVSLVRVLSSMNKTSEEMTQIFDAIEDINNKESEENA